MKKLIGIVAAFAAVVALLALAFYLGNQAAQVRMQKPPPPVVAPPPPATPPAPAPEPETIHVQAEPMQVARPDSAPPGKPPAFGFDHVEIDTSRDAAEACLHFSAPLSTDAALHYQDFLTVTPEAALALRVAGQDLCLGGLSYQASYTLKLAAGLPAASGARLERPVTLPIQLGDRPRMVAFAGDGYILPRIDATGVTITTTNVDHVRVRVLRMSDRLLPSQLLQSYQQPLQRGTIYPYALRELLAKDASVVWTGTVDVENRHNQLVKTAFPLTDVIKERKPGAYLLLAEDAAVAPAKEDDEDAGWDESGIANQWVIDSDVVLTAASGADGLHVTARSLSTAKPLGNIQVALVSAGQDELARFKTDNEGRAEFAPGLLRGKGAASAKFVLGYGGAGDFALLNLDRPAFDFSDRGVSGRPQPGAADAFLYTDRGIYRPGETVHLGALLRDRVGNAIDSMPVTIVLRRPDGIEYRRLTLPAAAGGGGQIDVALSDSANHGLWSAEARVDPVGAAVGKVEFEVDDFVPQRLKVTLSGAPPVLHPGDAVGIMLDGQYLYGAPAAGLTGEATVVVAPDPAPFANFPGYQFGFVDDPFKGANGPLDISVPDAAGHATVSGKLPEIEAIARPLKATITAGLFEPGGRYTATDITVPVVAPGIQLGIKPRFTDGRVEEGTDAAFEIVAVDEHGQQVARPGLAYRFIYERRTYDWYSEGGRWNYHYSVTDEPLASGTVDAAADRVVAISAPVDWGSYRLEVEDPESGHISSTRFHAGWQSAAGGVETPDKVTVEVERKSYAPGDDVKLKIKPPFAGEADIMVASDRVFERRNAAIPTEGATVDFTASSEWGNGAYILISMYRPLHGAASVTHEPVRAVGLAWIPLDTASRTLDVALTVPDKSLPRQGIDLPIKVAGVKPGEPAFVTIAAVDEGILQLTRFASPAPDGYFFGKRRLGIDLRDDYGKLLDGTDGKLGAVHEGGDAGVGGKALPVVPTRSIALFSGPVKLADDGTGSVHFDLPDFNGRLRLMAVAWSATRVGKGEASLIVRDPVVAEIIFPRFLAPGDQAGLTVDLANTDGAAGTYSLKPSLTGPAELKLDHPLDYALGAGEHKTDRLGIAGTDEGIATLTASLAGPNGFNVTHDWSIAVRSPNYPLTVASTEAQKAGDTFTFDPHRLDPFLPGSVKVSIGYSRLKGIDVPGLLQSLYRYPYGCTEQLASVAGALLHYGDEALLGRVPRDAGIKARVQKAIDTIEMRQDASGEFGLWRANDHQASPWLNLYAIEFLEHAKAAGFGVSNSTLDLAYGWVKLQLRNWENEYQRRNLKGLGEDRAYAYYLLAKAGRIEIGDVRYLHDTMVTAAEHGVTRVSWGPSAPDEQASSLALGHLAGALEILGDRARARDTFRLAIDQIGVDPDGLWWFWRFYWSQLRDLAGLIAIAADSDGLQDTQPLVDRLQGTLWRNQDLSTQEIAQLLDAAYAVTKGDPALALSVNGAEPASSSGAPAFAPDAAAINAGYTIANRADRDLWRTVVVTGVPKVAPSAVNAGFSIEKRYFTLDGKPLKPASLHQNDRFLVSVRGAANDNEPHRAVLVDMLPAGWEIEGVVTDNDAYAWLDYLLPTRMHEARDDRFVAAFDLNADKTGLGWLLDDDEDDSHDQDKKPKNWKGPAKFHVAYIVRAITPGKYALPGAVIEDMYRPGVMGRTAIGAAAVEPAK